MYDNFDINESIKWCHDKLKEKKYEKFEEWCKYKPELRDSIVIKKLKLHYERLKTYNALYDSKIKHANDVLVNWKLDPEKYLLI